MLIDAAHPEETRVAVVDSGRLAAFEFDSKEDRQLSGNIYLARVTRVEPALQAAFVDYGGDRDGFLALSDIHPDYYQIPDGDRQTLLQEDREAAAQASADEDDAGDEGDPEATAAEEVRKIQPRRSRNYAIQEVIKRRQVLLVQIYREPRGKKGAALTTYLSLAGRYCVLAPNTARGGGISRKISATKDRAKLKAIVRDLEILPEHGVIIRTAGSGRTKAEIKRDYMALLKQWDEIRTRTLESFAPTLIHEESSLIRRAVRDLYDRDIGEILVEGEEGYRDAKKFMRQLTPSHAKFVKQYREETPIFLHHKVDSQLDALFTPHVPLPSGGWIMFEQTEALTAVDVNSGRSTRERSVENTALRTNLEAADEIARQLQLRDLSGLIVLDFIDMDVERNRRAVESRLKERLRPGRSRVQTGRISSFGLLEMSRQRRRKSMIDISTDLCPACGGSGRRRTDPSLALAALRRIEEQAEGASDAQVTVRAPIGIANFLCNEKRTALTQAEQRLGIRIIVEADPHAETGRFEILWGGTEAPAAETRADTANNRHEARRADNDRPRTRRGGRNRTDKPASAQRSADPPENGADAAEAADPADGGAPREGRRRRGRRGGRGRRRNPASEDGAAPLDAGGETQLLPDGRPVPPLAADDAEPAFAPAPPVGDAEPRPTDEPPF